MRKLYAFTVALSLFGVASAQTVEDDYVIPEVIEDLWIQKLSPGGTMAAGQDGGGVFALGYDLTKNELYYYATSFPGDGNCVADNGLFVGQEWQATGIFAAVFKNGISIVTEPLKVGGYSIMECVTRDGKRAAGYILNGKSYGPYFMPFVCDINENGIPGNPKLLPVPDYDFFGNRADYVIPTAISDDGKTIAGLVDTYNGGFGYPIIFRQDEDGNWSYSEPTKVLFNPNNEPLPTNPEKDEEYQALMDREPHPEDFMDPDQANLYLQMKRINPNFDAYWNYQTDEQYDAYYAAHMSWADEVEKRYFDVVPGYRATLNRLGKDQHFGGLALMDPQGQTFYTNKSGQLYEFNLKTDEFAPSSIRTNGAILTQVQEDGTCLATSMSGASPYEGYIRLPGETSFMKVTEYLEKYNPSYLYWIDDQFLKDNRGTIVTGQVCMSYDKKTVTGGYYDGQEGAISFAFSPNFPQAGQPEEDAVEEINAENADTFEVFNINGMKVTNAKNMNEVNSLPKGIYIVNGKKVII